MVISAERGPPTPDPSPPATAPPPPQVTAAGEVSGGHNHLHSFSFPVLKTWGNQRLLRCANVNRKGEIIGAGGRRPPSVPVGTRIRSGAAGTGEDPGLEEVREKLLVHLREAADQMNLALAPSRAPSPAKEPDTEPEPEPEPEPSSSAVVRPWNLRSRRGTGARVPAWFEGGSLPPAATAERRVVRLRSEDCERRERAKFSICLTREEIDEDIYAVTGSRARRRPKKRPRAVQKQLDSVFPGSWLTEITADSYRVPE